jgi:hypothetical protein
MRDLLETVFAEYKRIYEIQGILHPETRMVLTRAYPEVWGSALYLDLNRWLALKYSTAPDYDKFMNAIFAKDIKKLIDDLAAERTSQLSANDFLHMISDGYLLYFNVLGKTQTELDHLKSLSSEASSLYQPTL